MANPRADEVKPKKPVTRAQFKAAKYTTTHVTEHGYCVHDYLLLPCQRQRNCLECTEHRCIKGDKAKTERVRFCLHEAEEQLARDEQACAEGTIGADVYLRQNRRRVNELRELVAILDDPNVPEGSEIVFSGEEYSPIIKAIDQRIALGDKDAKILAAVRARNATLPGPLYLVK
jgi:hypothetical protein